MREGTVLILALAAIAVGVLVLWLGGGLPTEFDDPAQDNDAPTYLASIPAETPTTGNPKLLDGDTGKGLVPDYPDNYDDWIYVYEVNILCNDSAATSTSTAVLWEIGTPASATTTNGYQLDRAYAGRGCGSHNVRLSIQADAILAVDSDILAAYIVASDRIHTGRTDLIRN